MLVFAASARARPMRAEPMNADHHAKVEQIVARSGASARDELAADLARRQPLLAVINLVVALLFALGMLGTASAGMLPGWLAYAAIVQAVRLAAWSRWRHAVAAGLPTGPATSALVATSAAAGIGWGSIG